MGLEKTDNLLLVCLKGKVSRHDYDQRMTEIECFARELDSICMRVEMDEFEGWDATSPWEDVRFDSAFFDKVRKIAFIGDRKWQNWMRGFCKPFTEAEIRFFESGEAERAHEWLAA